MNEEMIIKFSVPGGLRYQMITWTNKSDFFSLPWGKMEVENVTISGDPWSSAGGAWYWELPNFCIMGYGQYNPWVKFKFSGTITVTRERNFPRGIKWGWRQTRGKWVYLTGNITPCEEYIAEKLFQKIYKEKERIILENYPWVELNKYPFKQGHLEGKTNLGLSRIITEDERFGRVQAVNFSRRKIFNHQFFGKDIQILYIDLETWAAIAPEGGNVVSPDHLDEPLKLEKGITIFTHPFPDDDID